MNEPHALCTITLILATGLVTWRGFRDRGLEERLIFDPRQVLARKQYYRLVTSAFLHADWLHLGLNLFSLYSFGAVLELCFGPADLLLIYFGAVVGGDLLSLYIHRHHEYRSYGASGGVCGVLFAYILLFPGGSVNLFPLPFGVPGWLYAIGFMLGSFYGIRSGRENIGHDAHLGGAIVGLLIAAALNPGEVRANWMVFSVVLMGALLLWVYLWLNPLMLDGFSISLGKLRLAKAWRRRPASAGSRPRSLQESRQIDALLDKISAEGLHSLTEEERALLEGASARYRRRAETKKPESGLAI